MPTQNAPIAQSEPRGERNVLPDFQPQGARPQVFFEDDARNHRQHQGRRVAQVQLQLQEKIPQAARAAGVQAAFPCEVLELHDVVVAQLQDHAGQLDLVFQPGFDFSGIRFRENRELPGQAGAQSGVAEGVLRFGPPIQLPLLGALQLVRAGLQAQLQPERRGARCSCGQQAQGQGRNQHPHGVYSTSWTRLTLPRVVSSTSPTRGA